LAGRLGPGVLRLYRHVLQRGGRRAPTHHTVTSCLHFTSNVSGVTFGVTFVTFHGIEISLNKPFSIQFPVTNSGVLCHSPLWDITPRPAFVSMKDISRLSWNLPNADLRAREEENGLWIVEYYRLGPTFRAFQSGFQTETETSFLYQSQTMFDICDGHKMSQFQICDLGHTLWIFFSFFGKTDCVTFCSQMVTDSNVTGTNLFLFLFRLKWFGMNEIRQNLSESELCFCFLFGIWIGSTEVISSWYLPNAQSE